jgi:fatty-acyl-CoA synthase
MMVCGWAMACGINYLARPCMVARRAASQNACNNDGGAMARRAIRSLADIEGLEAEAPFEQRLAQHSVWELLQANAAHHGARPAVTFLPQGQPDEAARTWTHSDLLARARRFANLLHRLGVAAPDGVALAMSNRPEFYAAFLGSQAIAVPCPASPLLSPVRLAGILSAGGCRVIVTEGPSLDPSLWQRVCDAVQLAGDITTVLALRGAGPGMPPQVAVHDFDAACTGEADQALDFRPVSALDAPAARFHTGGTTGAPKLAVHSQRNHLHAIWAMEQLAGFDTDDVALVGLPLFHVHAAIPLGLAPLARGAHLVLLGPQGFRHAAVMQGFWRIARRFGGTVFSAVPTVYAGLLDAPRPDGGATGLRLALCGSAPLPVQTARDFEAQVGIGIVEGYGLTEATCVSSLNPVDGPRRTGSIGLRLPYQPMKVSRLDEAGRWVADCAPGEAGTLLVSGPNVFAGYVDPAQDREAFAAPGWLNTGDLGCVDAEGYFRITGRAKDLIKRSGHSVDPKAVEEALHAHPAVALAAVVARPDARAGEVPVAFVTPRSGSCVDASSLAAHCARHGVDPVSMPVHFHVLEALPLTAVGKLDKVQLRAIAATSTATGDQP